MTSPERPWFAGEAASEGDKRHAPATLRNRDAIADAIRPILPESGTVLEIASGSGEHAIHFAGLFPNLTWQPSDPDPHALRSIAAWSADCGLANLLQPVMLDAAEAAWPVRHADAILCINMIHISPWAATEGLVRGSSKLLPAGRPLILYGPYLQDGVETAPSNLAFDQNLKSRDSRWGLRNIADVTDLAKQHGFDLVDITQMPANNITVSYIRR